VFAKVRERLAIINKQLGSLMRRAIWLETPRVF